MAKKPKLAAAKTAKKKIASSKKKPAKKKTSAFSKWLAKDSTYKTQNAQASAAFKRFEAGQKLNDSQNSITYKRNLEDNTEGRKNTLSETNDNFAARGMARSGKFIKAKDDVSKNFNRQRSALIQGRNNFKNDAAYEKTNAAAQKKDAMTRAKQDATDRYAQRRYL